MASRPQVGILVLLVLFSPLAIDIYLPALPQISETFHVKHSSAQDTITWFLFALGVGQLVAGPLADKYGRKSIAVCGVMIYGLSALLAWVSWSIEWLLVARLMQGLGACATSVAAFATVRDIYGPEKSGRMISYLNGAICFIPALAPILGSYLTQNYGWRSNFAFMAGYALIVVSLLMLWLKETNPESGASSPPFKFERYIGIVSNTNFLFHSILCLMAMAVILAYVTSAPLVLMEQMGLSMNEFTFWFGVNACFNIAAAFIAPKIMDKIGTRGAQASGVVALLLGGSLMLILPSQKEAWAFMLPIIFSSIGFALVLSTAAGKALAPFGDKAGTAAALLGLFQMSGAGLLVGTSQRLGLEPQYTIAVHMLIFIPILFLLNSRQGKIWHQAYG